MAVTLFARKKPLNSPAKSVRNNPNPANIVAVNMVTKGI
jgi:hypothetical protein